MEEHYRAFTPDLQVRAGGDGRTVSGIAVPYNLPVKINSRLTEKFSMGAFRHQIRAGHRVPFMRDHRAHGGALIGKTLLLREDGAGLYGEWRISATASGDETLELIKDGALDQLSIGFREHASGNRKLPGGVVERIKADLLEVAVVMLGAYGEGAALTGVRAEEKQERLEIAKQLLAGLPILPV